MAEQNVFNLMQNDEIGLLWKKIYQLHQKTKIYLLTAEEISENGDALIQPLKEHRDAYDHIVRIFASTTKKVPEKGIDEYSKDKEECVLNTDNVTQFTYKGDSFTILDDTLSNSELGEWVGYIRKLAVIDSNGKILLQQDTEKATFKTLADIADSKPDAAYIIPFLNVYTVKDGNTQELIVDVNGGYHKAILNRFVTDKDTIFRYNQKTEATAEGEFTINTQNCTQLLCGDKVYQITDETVPYENIGEYIDIIAESYTFDNDTKLQIPKEELYHIDWSGKEKSSQKREQWTIGGIYEILHKDRTDSVAVEVNSEYRVAKCQ